MMHGPINIRSLILICKEILLCVTRLKTCWSRWRPRACWNDGFDSSRGHGFFCLLWVLCAVR